jgi:hypothetical protein
MYTHTTNPDLKKPTVVIAEEGKKFDAGKLRHSLIPPGVLNEVLAVLEHGASKYGDNNWLHVADSRTRYYDAAHRHLAAWWEGGWIDEESECHHLAHAVCCLMFLMALGEK